jgi:hypothetical protein
VADADVMRKKAFIPKSTAKLVLGDYCSLKRDDGKFAPLVFLSKVGNARSYFYGALLSQIQESEVIPEGKNIFSFFEVALLPIKVFSENNSPIIGNIADRLSKPEVTLTLQNIETKTNVWGYRTPIQYGNRIPA